MESFLRGGAEERETNRLQSPNQSREWHRECKAPKSWAVVQIRGPAGRNLLDLLDTRLPALQVSEEERCLPSLRHSLQ